MDLPIPLRPRTLPQSVLAAGARLVGLIYAGSRTIVLVGPHGAGKSLTLDVALDGMPGTVHRVVNHGIGPLDLPAILAQLGTGPREKAGLPALLQALRADPARPVVLAIDDAQTLTGEALATLAGLAAAREGDFAPILILAGTPGLRALLSRRGLRGLRGRDNLLVLPSPGPEPGAPRGAGLVRPLRAGTVAGALVALLLGAILLFGSAPVPVPEAVVNAPAEAAAPAWPAAVPPVAQASAEPSAAASAEAEVGAPRSAAQEPGGRPDPGRVAEGPVQPASVPAGPTEAQLRQEFLQFLDRAGPDTARLPPARREALFGEYLAWRARGGEARGP